ncbi:hypothetical protein LCGC14_0478920 [marine sediment metagenome]|uniref:Uncharacterized protein n=1 Tax=marine sediment metagenome TaxID=412755 RepID=A0A0F9VIU0_9ZZZZ
MIERTTVDIVRDLLDDVKHNEWTEYFDWNHNRSYVTCSYCRAPKVSKGEEGHEKDCYLLELIKAAEGFINVEEDLLNEKEVPNDIG